MFFELGRVRPGDRLKVTRRDRSVAIFEVTRVRRYPKVRFPTQLVYGDTDDAALRLITCGGLSDSSTGTTWTTSWCSPHPSAPGRRRPNVPKRPSVTPIARPGEHRE